MTVKKIYAVGDEIFTECGKCKSEMHHIVTAMKDDEVKKVMCKGCNTTHLYRGKKKKAKATDAAGPKKVKRRSSKKDWGKLTAEMVEEEFVAYDMRHDFSEQRGINTTSLEMVLSPKYLATHN